MTSDCMLKYTDCPGGVSCHQCKQLDWNLQSFHKPVAAAAIPSGAPLVNQINDAALLLLLPFQASLDGAAVPLMLLEKVALPQARTKCSASPRKLPTRYSDDC